MHKYKFVVDGEEKIDKNAAIDNDEVNNVLHVQESDFEVFEALAMDLASNNNNNNNSSSTNQPLSGSPPGISLIKTFFFASNDKHLFPIEKDLTPRRFQHINMMIMVKYQVVHHHYCHHICFKSF